MARQKKESVTVKENWPLVVDGRHSRFVFNDDGSFEHHIDWDKLGEEINQAIADYESLSTKVSSKTSPKTKDKDNTISETSVAEIDVSKSVKKTKSKKST